MPIEQTIHGVNGTNFNGIVQRPEAHYVRSVDIVGPVSKVLPWIRRCRPGVPVLLEQLLCGAQRLEGGLVARGLLIRPRDVQGTCSRRVDAEHAPLAGQDAWIRRDQVYAEQGRVVQIRKIPLRRAVAVVCDRSAVVLDMRNPHDLAGREFPDDPRECVHWLDCRRELDVSAERYVCVVMFPVTQAGLGPVRVPRVGVVDLDAGTLDGTQQRELRVQNSLRMGGVGADDGVDARHGLVEREAVFVVFALDERFELVQKVCWDLGRGTSEATNFVAPFESRAGKDLAQKTRYAGDENQHCITLRSRWPLCASSLVGWDPGERWPG